MRSSHILKMGAVAALTIAVAACAARTPAQPFDDRANAFVMSPQAPPPPEAEKVPPPPQSRAGVSYVWQPGDWRWTGSAYVWHPGEYAERPLHVEGWIAPYWDERGGEWFYVRGRWAFNDEGERNPPRS